jgi:hypothetical protein
MPERKRGISFTDGGRKSPPTWERVAEIMELAGNDALALCAFAGRRTGSPGLDEARMPDEVWLTHLARKRVPVVAKGKRVAERLCRRRDLDFPRKASGARNGLAEFA